MRKLLLIFLFLYSNAFGTITSVTQDTTITSGTAADTFRLANNVSAVGNVFTINGTADSITFDLNGYTVTYNTAGSDSITGIYITGVDHVTLMNGQVTAGYDDTTTILRSRGVNMTGGQYNTIRGISVTYGGYTTSTDYVNGLVGIMNGNGTTAFMNKIVSCTVTVNVVGFYRRDTWPAEAIVQVRELNDALISDPTTQYHLWVDSTVVNHARHSALFFYGSNGSETGVLWASNNKFTVDARNDGPYTGYRYGESYAIALEGVEIFKIWNNDLGYDSSYFGGMGIFIANCRTTDFQGYYSTVYNNTIRASIGPLSVDTTSSVGHVSGIRIRLGSEKIKLYNNTIYSYSDTISTTYFRTGYATGFFIGYDNAANSCDSIYIYNNTITTITDGDEAAPLSFMSNCDTCVLETYNNHLYSNSYLYHYASDGGGAFNILSYQDTLEWSGTLTNNYALVGGVLNNTWDSYDNTIRDMYLVNGVSDTNIYFTGTAGNNDFDLYRTLNITVNDTNSLPVANAVCTLWNDLGAVINIDTSDANGLFTSIEKYWYESNTNPDTTNIQPFDFRIWSSDGTDSVAAYNWVMINESGSRDTTVTLSATAGSSPSVTRKIRKVYIRKGKI